VGGLPEFADTAVGAVEESAVDDDSGAESRAESDPDEVFVVLARTKNELTEGEDVGVVVDAGWKAEA